MDALRPIGLPEITRRSVLFAAIIVPTIFGASGCALFPLQPAMQPAAGEPKPAITVPKAPAKPADGGKAALAADAEPAEDDPANVENVPQLSAIEQWAEQMAKRRATAESGGSAGQPALRNPATAKSEPRVLFEATPAADDGETIEPAVPVAAAPRAQRPGRASTNPVATPPAPEPAEVSPVEPAPPQPPTVNGVNAAVAARLVDSPRSSPVNDSREGSSAGTAETSASLKELLDRWLSQAGDNSFRPQLDRRVLQVLSGDYEKARQPLESVTTEQQAMATRFIEALIAIHEGHGGEPGREAGRVLQHVDELREALLPTIELSIAAFSICKSVKGFGQFEVFDPPAFVAGREAEFVAYCEIRDFMSEKRPDGMFQSVFGMKLAVLSRSGETVHQVIAEEMIDRCRSRRRDCFLSPLVRLPATLSPGEYVVKATISDKIGRKVAEKTATLRIVSRS